MGVHKYTYLGPYLRCKNSDDTYTTSVTACTNPNCSKRYQAVSKDIRFCPSCGKAAEIWAKPEKCRKIDPYEVFKDELSEVHCHSRLSENVNILVPNVTRENEPERLKGSHHDPEVGFRTIGAEDITSETAWFADAFAPEIAKARAAYGEGNVFIEWGIAHYYM